MAWGKEPDVCSPEHGGGGPVVASAIQRIGHGETGEAQAEGKRYVLIALLLASILSFVDRQILSLLVHPIEHDLHLNDTAMALLLGPAFLILHLVIGLPIGRLVDTYPRFKGLSLGMALWSLATAGAGLASNFVHLFVARIGVGFGEAFLGPTAYSVLPDAYPPHRIGRASAIYSMGVYIGAGLALVIGSQVIRLLAHVQEITLPVLGVMHSWQLVFVVIGLPGILVALWIFRLPEPPRRDPNGISASRPALREVLAFIRANLRALASVTFCAAFSLAMSYGTGAWVPTFLIRSYGWSIVHAGAVYGVVVVVGGVTGVNLAGALSDALTRKGIRSARLLVMCLASVLTLPFAIAFPLAPNPYVAMALMLPAVIFSTFAPAAMPVSVQEIVPNRMRGAVAAGLILFTSVIGLGFGPVLVSLFTNFVLHSQAQLRYSLAVVPPAALLTSAIIGFSGLGAFSRARDRLRGTEATLSAN